jgi:ferrous iron transport protein A
MPVLTVAPVAAALAVPAVPAAPPASTLTLDRLPPHRPATVWQVHAGADGRDSERARQLADIGFLPGEPVSVVARAWPGGDPLVVRVGQSRFALRVAEAACIEVRDGA